MWVRINQIGDNKQKDLVVGFYSSFLEARGSYVTIRMGWLNNEIRSQVDICV